MDLPPTPNDDETVPTDAAHDGTWTGHRAGYVALVGRPNAGKSTLLNAILEEHLAIVTPRPQTTRHRILGIYDRRDCQVLFVDTPGLVEPRDRMHEFMSGESRRALEDADVTVLLVDGIKGLTAREEAILSGPLANVDPKSLLVFCNKMDRVPPPDVMALQEALLKLDMQSGVEILYGSALRSTGLDDVLAAIIQRLPEGPKYYGTVDDTGEPVDVPLTDRTERFMASELVREQAYRQLRDEVPHEMAVAIKVMKDDPDRNKVYIEAEIVVERDSQRGILIGKGGLRLKRIGQDARAGIEAMLDRPVYLALHVRVESGWRKNPRLLKELGYDPGTVY